MRFKVRGIKARLNLAMMTVFAIALILDFALLIPATFTAARKSAAGKQLAVASGIAGQFDDRFMRARAETEALAALPDIASLDKRRMDAAILAANAANHFFDYFFVMDGNGVWVSFPSRGDFVGSSVPPENMSWVRQVFSGNQSLVLGVLRSKLGTLVTGVASPVRGPGGEPIALLRGVIALSEEDSLVGIVKGARAGPRSDCILAASDGTLLASSGRSDGGGSWEPPEVAGTEAFIKAAEGGAGSLVYADAEGTFMASYAHIPATGWNIIIRQPLGDVLANARDQVFGSTALFLLTILFCLLSLRVILGRSISEFAAFVESLRSGNAPDPASIRSADEIGDLAREFARLYGDVVESKRRALESEARIARLKRFEDLGILAAGIAHNFKNILQGIGASAELLSPEIPGSAERLPANIRDISNMVAQGSDLATSLMRLGKGQSAEQSPLDVAAVVADLAGMFGHLHSGISIDMKLLRSPATVMGNRSALEQVFLNLFLNAAQAMGEKGRISISVEDASVPEELAERGAGEGGWVQVVVRDSGPGMDDATLSRIFEPFFTRKSGGTGLGLSSAFRIVREHGGMLSGSSGKGLGATFRIHLPLIEEPAG